MLVELYDKTASLQDRTVGTGILSHALVQQFGAGGYVGRASGRNFDARRSIGYAPYDQLTSMCPYGRRATSMPAFGSAFRKSSKACR